MPEARVQPLLKNATVAVRDICCQGNCKHVSAEEYANAAHLVFPYRGVFARHLGRIFLAPSGLSVGYAMPLRSPSYSASTAASSAAPKPAPTVAVGPFVHGVAWLSMRIWKMK